MEKKRIKKNIGVGYVVNVKVGDMKEKIGEVIARRMRKEVVGFLQAMAEKKIFLVQLKYGQKKEMSSFLLQYFFSKEEVGLDTDEPISNLHEKQRGELLTINGDPDA